MAKGKLCPALAAKGEDEVLETAHTGEPDEVGVASRAGKLSHWVVWLIWTAWIPLFTPVIVDLFQSPRTWTQLAPPLGGVVLFFSVYLWASWRSARYFAGDAAPAPWLVGRGSGEVWLPIVVLTALAVVLALANGKEWLVLFYYIAGYTGGRLPTARVAQVIAGLILLIIAVGLLLNAEAFSTVQAVLFICVISAIMVSVTRAITTSQELRAAREEIARLAVTTERLRIARDLHDLLDHNLSLIALKSELAGRLLSVAPARAAIEVADIEQVARTTLQEVREAVGNYRQPTLSGELHGAHEILAAAGITYRYEGEKNIVDILPTTIEAVLAWAVREGVTNVIKHSRARQCTISMTHNTHTAGLEVIDDGTGVLMAPATQSSGVAPMNGMVSTDGTGRWAGARGSGSENGLRGLAERVATLGGHCEAGLRADGGFRLAVSVPLAQRGGIHGAATVSRALQTPVAPPAHPSGSNYEERNEQ